MQRKKKSLIHLLEPIFPGFGHGGYPKNTGYGTPVPQDIMHTHTHTFHTCRGNLEYNVCLHVFWESGRN